MGPRLKSTFFVFVCSAPGLLALWVLMLPLCDAIFQCGCDWAWSWSEGIAHCNIHDPSTHDCPWCSGGPWRQLTVLGSFSLLIMLTVAWSRRVVPGWATPLVGVVAVAPASFLIGLVTSLVTGYPFFGRLLFGGP
ncbi:MAG: hypothetical protein ACE366_12840 [Bradymonadia bacterium]